MKTAEQWFAEYQQSHQNRINQRIHFVCVPAIFWSVLTAFWLLPTPGGLNEHFSWAYAAIFFTSLFYLRLGIRYFFVMVTASFIALGIDHFFEVHGWPLLPCAIGVFVVAWIGQFYGHIVERRKPSFFKDLQFLLIGPLWIAIKAGLAP